LCLCQHLDLCQFLIRGQHTDSGTSILIVEDESDLADVLSYHLEREGYTCHRARDSEAALAEVRRSRPDLIVLDRMLPKLSGDEVATRLRRDPHSADVPIIMLTPKPEDADELVGFALGANDYVRKPSSIKLLPAALSGVVAAVLLALACAIGETMAVTLAAGMMPKLTANPLESIQTMTACIVQVSLGDTPAGTVECQTIFAVGMTLFLITLAINLIAQRVLRRFREAYE